MPAESKYRESVLALLRSSSTPLTANAIATAIHADANVCAKYLLDAWRKHVIVRSERAFAKEYHYFFGTHEKERAVRETSVLFIAYQDEYESRKIKEHIQNVLRTRGPSTAKEVSYALKPRADLTFIKKVNFHLQQLFNKQQLDRSSKPFQYFFTPDAIKVRSEKASLPAKILALIRESTTALFTSEIQKELTNKHVHTTLSSISVTLARLCRQQKIVSSETRFGTRGQKTGFLWARDKKLVIQRFLTEITPEVRELLASQNEIIVRDFCTILHVSPTHGLRWMRRIAAELPEFILMNGLLSKRSNHGTS